MPAITYAYRGLMAPVFTQFNADGAVIHTAIDAYAAWLRSAGIGAVLVNGTSGEGPNLTVDERRSSAQHWANACRSHRLSLMVQCSGNLALPDVQRMAEHAQQIGADAVLLLPDLFWRPRSEEALMEYCGRVAKHCDRTPVLYYHYPAQTGVELNMPRFLDLAEAAIPNFCGLKYTSSDLAIGAACLKPSTGRSVFLGADTVLSGALVLGFDSACMTTLNMWPQQTLQIMSAFGEATNAGIATAEIQKAQQELNGKIAKALQRSGDWVADMKAAMHEELERTDASFRLGASVRRPKMM